MTDNELNLSGEQLLGYLVGNARAALNMASQAQTLAERAQGAALAAQYTAQAAKTLQMALVEARAAMTQEGLYDPAEPSQADVDEAQAAAGSVPEGVVELVGAPAGADLEQLLGDDFEQPDPTKSFYCTHCSLWFNNREEAEGADCDVDGCPVRASRRPVEAAE